MADLIDDKEMINYMKAQKDQLQIKLAQLEQRPHIKSVQEQPFNSLEKPVLSVGTQTPNLAWPDSAGQSANANDHLGKQIADHIDSIVGLRETVTESHSVLKWVWAIALLVGVGATIYFVYAAAGEYFDAPTATKVEMRQQESYEYPPFLLCPEEWLDVDRALSLGLSLDALKYSLGYINPRLELKNATYAKEMFLRVYENHNFSSLEDYFFKISVELTAITEVEQGTIAKENSSVFCSTCVNSPARDKVFSNQGVCYLFQYAPEPGSKSRKPNHVLVTYMAVHDRTRGLVPISSFWRFFLTSSTDLMLKYSTSSLLYLHSHYLITVRISTQHFISLKGGATNCVDRNEVDSNYSAETCYAKCLNEVIETSDCHQFSDTLSGFTQIQPKEYCNTYDQEEFMELLEHLDRASKQTKTISESSRSIDCIKNCPIKCDRMAHDAYVSAEIEPKYPERRALFSYANVSAIMLDIEHSAKYDGGVWTLTEVSTISFISMVSNLGGTLGLFVGGTMMTFVQVILFIVKYFLKKSYN